MKPLLLFLAILTASAADLEQITLTDGRHLVGVYDDIAGTVTLDGPGAAVIKIKPDQIKAREVYVKADAPPVAKAAPVAPPAATANGDSSQAALARAIEEGLALRDKATRIEYAACMKWLHAQDFTQKPVPELGPDPRKSEVELVKKTRSENAQRDRLVQFLRKASAAKTLDQQDEVIATMRAFLREDMPQTSTERQQENAKFNEEENKRISVGVELPLKKR